jgi:hypothetical protein
MMAPMQVFTEEQRRALRAVVEAYQYGRRTPSAYAGTTPKLTRAMVKRVQRIAKAGNYVRPVKADIAHLNMGAPVSAADTAGHHYDFTDARGKKVMDTDGQHTWRFQVQGSTVAGKVERLLNLMSIR